MNDKPIIKPEQKGGFIQGLPIPIAQPTNTGGCCGGSTDSGTGGCCGGSSSGGGGCCGESASDVNISTNSSCC
jgi:hypothetical protein